MGLRHLLIGLLLLLSGIFSKVYSQTDSLLISDSFLGYKYFYQGEKLSGNDVLELLSEHPAYGQFKSANEAHIFGGIFAVGGAVLILTPFAVKVTGNNPNWSMAWAGGGLMLVSVPLLHKYKKNVPKAIYKYNQQPNAKIDVTAELRFGTTPNGVGLSLVF